ncbi:ABC transporter permease [Halomonas sp. BC04]|uniref:ABC transporter permease n=1 Tax=Halomonas sp. BC04 TaxID=1403540 RepID=UPI0003ED6915|nr:ABC transporter permease [Halomonas sp. BC04]EWG97762.1 hypothetical protein Q427_34260 [Halomonas sp. BC04]
MTSKISKSAQQDELNASESAIARQRTVGENIKLYSLAILRDPTALFALVWLTLILVATFGVDLLAPFSPTDQSLRLRNMPPLTPSPDSWFPHLFGTDALGRDVFSRVLYAGQLSLAVGFSGVIVSGGFGVMMGLIAGYYGGKTDSIIMRVVDLQIGFPFLMLAIFFLYALGPGFWNVVIVLAIVRWPVYARVTRGMTLSLREQQFVESARVVGCSNRRIIGVHILPNLISPILVLATLEVARLILAESALSFLGLGVQPPETSWGRLIADGRQYISTAWWLVAVPGFFIFLTALSANLLATWARAVTDPVQRWRWLVKGQKPTPAKTQAQE